MMQKSLILLFMIMILAGCSSTPDKVLSESEMEDLLVDIHKSEAIIELNSGKYYSDSLKKIVKQSVFAKHGVDQETFDSSLVWYGHHMKVYSELYDNVIKRLESEEKNLDKAEKDIKPTVGKQPMRKYAVSGDTADLWDKDRVWMFIEHNGANIVKFDFDAINDNKNGDRYMLVFNLRNNIGNVNVFMGADYFDGTTSYLSRVASNEGVNRYSLQGDSTKRIKRFYGYIKSSPKSKEVVFVDSLMLLRTRLDKAGYSLFHIQKWIGPKRLNPEKTKPQTTPMVQGEKNQVVDDKKTSDKQHFSPKPGLNKSFNSGSAIPHNMPHNINKR